MTNPPHGGFFVACGRAARLAATMGGHEKTRQQAGYHQRSRQA